MVGQGGVVECDIKRRPVGIRDPSMQSTPLGPWGVGAGACAGPATERLKGDSGRVADPNPCDKDQGGMCARTRDTAGMSA